MPTQPANDDSPAKAQHAAPITLEGRTVNLTPLTIEHADDLFPFADANGPYGLSLWKYIPDGPYYHVKELRKHIVTCVASPDSFFAVIDQRESVPTTGKAVGYLAIMNIVPEHCRLEIGNVIFAPPLQRTTGATEAIYLALKYAYSLGYIRVEWKCNNLNVASRRAAERLGFQYEGLFRRHMWVKGNPRDTAWFSMLRTEWLGDEASLKTALERWLDKENFDEQGRQAKSLQRFQSPR